MIEHLSDQKTLMSVRELAKGITYTDPIPTGWKPPTAIRRMSTRQADAIRRQWHILVEGDDVPPSIKNFKDKRLLEPILKNLKEKGIVQPTPIQVQGLPLILSGRDMIGIAFTRSGKILVFVLPLIMVALQEELIMPIVPGEGPFGLIVELTRQTFEVVEQFLVPLWEAGYPDLKPLLCIGGVDMRSQLEVVKKGVHIVVATPGRLKDLLAKKKMNLDNCRYLTLDEADRLVDLGFEDDIREGVEAVAIHGGKDQEKREYAIASFKSGKKDVLVATDVASKGLDFPDIQHVINYVMPVEIENYVHRIGRTGRCGKTCIATTFINKNQSETTLLDLKHLLQESKQRIPPVLAELNDPMEYSEALADARGVKGCAYCGGLGHRIRDCPKLEHHKTMAIAGSRRDYFGSGGYSSKI
ncbi:hypothetical protein IEQ34_012704 [Dendrobium chrysotoxum]|uniref:RNA helicase n=1 Tax=Dendrobium chrysotoxum TaxID=161865 RepID=A0AAV7GNX8_DENCH|nr:hypothetical protein IEQ34_012704 [Dendrobium chrysotoxum]